MLAGALVGRGQLGAHRNPEPPEGGGCPDVQLGVELCPWEGQPLGLCVAALARAVWPLAALLAGQQESLPLGPLGPALAAVALPLS